MSDQEKSTKAALCVCWTLNKHKKPFSDSEIVKECMLAAVTALFEEKKDVAGIQNIPLSARSNTRKTEILAADIKITLFELLQKAPCYAIVLDESCYIVDDEQMSIFVRFLDIESKTFREELLTILPLKGNTRGEDLFKENSEEDIAVFTTFLADLRNEFATRFQDFAEMGKLSLFLKSPFEVDVAAEWTDVAAKLFNLSSHHFKWK
ncbi:unnamed protein product [Parnassius apollo]|uniref:(apollo) hypothetical protein n=1 Tax=Parnassius apollo TaxID=110799 RepID=A0A8S3WB70_PARAO|nr:unnamed protein product [Parnassius apollo]